jgi:uncharacterized membrane protein YraQ (UPF0718 family)
VNAVLMKNVLVIANKMIELYIFLGALFLISLIASREKTKKSILIGFKRLAKMTLPLLLMLIFVSLILTFTPDSIILKYLSSGNEILNFSFALIIGSIIIIPGIAAFPLSKHLLDMGVSYGVISAFTTTLMLVGIITFHIEKKFLGTKLALLRNLFALIICIIIAIITGVVLSK